MAGRHAGSPDMIELFTRPDLWTGARRATDVFKFYERPLLADTSADCPECGRNIYPASIELLALRLGAVEKAAAFPLADPRLGERVCLAVVMRGNMQVEPEAILQHLDAAGLARSDMPEFILPLDQMPLTASGKVIKRDLVRWVEEGRARPLPVRFRG